VAEHVLPLTLDLIDVLRCADGVGVWNGDASVRAFLRECAQDARGKTEKVWVAVHVDYVVEPRSPIGA
jgi:hypothetical protein